jgi:hypothetical protein
MPLDKQTRANETKVTSGVEETALVSADEKSAEPEKAATQSFSLNS